MSVNITIDGTAIAKAIELAEKRVRETQRMWSMNDIGKNAAWILKGLIENIEEQK